ncbi:hypothetical protein [Nonlabens ulvanivorans]|uniref:hypothetical protein n=1 Tax=Nonlabens ulvanivorans TaxID=906888 RepID=UPI002942F095|nr:hypothetical protein [Nonlabens ulvanivorans]WOI22962.1 hypothetical protein R1T42_00655 [Nonlabens ulvanivorans]
MKRNVLYIILLYLISWNANSQIDNDSNLEQFNLYVLPQAQIEVKLSFDSRILRNDPRAFSVTPGREGIDMMAIYREKQDLEEKEYIPFVVAHFERKRQQQQEQQQSTLSRPSSLTAQNPYYSNSNYTLQQLRRQSYFNQLYRPIYRY